MTMIRTQQVRQQRDHLKSLRDNADRLRKLGLVMTADIMGGAADRWESFLDSLEAERDDGA